MNRLKNSAVPDNNNPATEAKGRRRISLSILLSKPNQIIIVLLLQLKKALAEQMDGMCNEINPGNSFANCVIWRRSIE